MSESEDDMHVLMGCDVPGCRGTLRFDAARIARVGLVTACPRCGASFALAGGVLSLLHGPSATGSVALADPPAPHTLVVSR